jgi:hypothetical protein
MQKQWKWHYLDWMAAAWMILVLLAILPTWGIFFVLGWAMFRFLNAR